MRALRIALLALVSLSVLDASSAFARGNGGAAGGGAGGAAGGGTGGAGTGSTPLAYSVIQGNGGDQRHYRPRYIPGKVSSSCFKQNDLYDRYGYAVVNLHGAECFQ